MRKKYTLTTLIIFLLLMANCLVASAQLILSITNPAAVCSPATVDITAPAITAGSTFPGGTTLGYYSDAAATMPIAAPAAIATTNTYYIKAVNGGSTDIEPVTVIIDPTPSLIIQQPNAVCTPATVDITAPEIAINHSNLPPGTVLNYYADAGTTSPIVDPEVITTSGNYYITATAAGCVSNIAAVVVTIKTSPSAPIVTNVHYCQFAVAAPLTAIADPGASLLWYAQPVGGSAGSPIAPVPSTSVGGVTFQYWVSQQVSGCESQRASLQVTTITMPVLAIHNPPTACSPATVDITSPTVAYYTPFGSTLSYYLDAEGTESLTTPSAIDSSGTYYIVVTAAASASCSDSKPVVVSIASSCNADSAVVVTGPLLIYPNPADQNLSISFNPDETGTSYLELINDIGQHVMNMKIVDGPLITISVASLPSGTYFYVIRNTDGKKIKSGKVVIKH
jgi:hypothetical protein